jgi:hypothetical protein
VRKGNNLLTLNFERDINRNQNAVQRGDREALRKRYRYANPQQMAAQKIWRAAWQRGALTFHDLK